MDYSHNVPYTNTMAIDYTTINSQNLAQTPSVKLPTYQPTPIDPNITQSALASVAGQYEAVNKQLEQAQREQEANRASQSNLSSALLGKTEDTQSFQQTAGVNAANDVLIQQATQLADLNAQAQSLQREAQAIPIQVENESMGRGRTVAGVAPIQTARLRDNALRALSIAQQSDVASAALTGSQIRLQAAKDKAQQMVDLKYKPIEDALAIKKEQYELNKDVLASVDKKRTEALSAAIKKEERELEEKKANEKGIADLVMNAAGQGAPEELRVRAAKAKTPMEAANILGVYAGDYLKNELLRAQIAKTKAEMVKVDTQTSLLTPQPTGVVTAPNGDAIGIPNDTLSAIGKLKLNEGQANAVAFTSRMIQSAKAIDSQLGKISPTGGFYETTGYDPTSAGSSFGRLVGSDQSRIYNTNAQDFIRAKLRKESGAAIGKDEFTADAAIYVPAGAGLDEKDLLLAKVKRDEAIKSMIAQAGPAAPYLQQYYEQSKTQGDAFMSENPQLNSWYQKTSEAVQTSTAQVSNGGGTYGFTDNQ